MGHRYVSVCNRSDIKHATHMFPIVSLVEASLEQCNILSLLVKRKTCLVLEPDQYIGGPILSADIGHFSKLSALAFIMADKCFFLFLFYVGGCCVFVQRTLSFISSS